MKVAVEKIIKSTRKLTVLVIAVVFLSCPTNAQICTCESNFEWVKKTFEENDAGFQYIIDKKGQAAYNIHNQIMLEKIKAAKTLTECTELLDEWLYFFRMCHIGVELLAKENAVYEFWEGDISQFEEYINSKKEVDYEGIWETRGYKIGIKKEGVNYIGFVIESDVDSWKTQGLVKFRIEQVGDKLKTVFYTHDHLRRNYDAPKLVGNNHLIIGSYLLLTRVSPSFDEDSFVEEYIKKTTRRELFLEELNANTLYLRIPSFDPDERKAINKLIVSNKKKILKTDNLIIDLCDNGGGSDVSFQKLLPLIYTNPIYAVGAEFLSTPLNVQLLLDFANSKENSLLERLMVKRLYKKMRSRLGEFVNFSNDTIDTYHRKTVYQYPKNIGIIINNGCASTTEQFLLFAKQSAKVKLFGANTFGCLDISNVMYVESPCKEFELCYGLSRCLRINETAIDGIGIPPDYYIDETIPQYKWVEFVNDVLNQ
jgi:hypothetical protein